MPKVTIFDAGTMGSGLANALVEAGQDVNLQGTWLDDHLIDTIEGGRPHPHVNVVISSKVHPFRSIGLEDTFDGVDIVVVSVTSQGVPKVTKMTLPEIARAKALWLASRGFMPIDSKILLLPDRVRSTAKAADVELPPIVAVAGPVKANKYAAGEPTATIFRCKSRDVAVEFARAARSKHYCVKATDGEVGMEICASMGNMCVIMLGITGGLEEKTGKPHHDLKAVTSNKAMRGVSILSMTLGAGPTAACGLPGIGDLGVTGLSGRNEVYGVCIGRGEGARGALQVMTELGQTIGDAPALPLAISLVEQSAPQIKDRLPLLYAARQIVEEDVPDYTAVLARAILPPKP